MIVTLVNVDPVAMFGRFGSLLGLNCTTCRTIFDCKQSGSHCFQTFTEMEKDSPSP